MQYIAPLITVRLEANSIPELMDALDALMGNLTAQGVSVVGTPRLSNDLASVTVDTVQTPKPKTRAKKTEDQTPPAPEETEETPAPVTPPSTMQNLSAADARNKGISMIQTYFATNPSVLPQITAISTKYGVSAFADVKDEDSHKFLADISLIVSGNGEVA